MAPFWSSAEPKMVLVPVFLLMFWSGWTNGLQWTKIPQSQEVRPGETVILECDVQDENAQLHWIKRDSSKPVLFSRSPSGEVSSMTQGDTSFSIVNGFDLRISGIQLAKHNGKYTCQASEESKEAQVVVLVAPSPPEVSSDQNLRRQGPYIEGTEVTLTCASRTGNPRPEITWTRNGVEIQEARMEEEEDGDRPTKAILVHRFTREDNGVDFRCSVKNSAISTPLETDFRVGVNYGPRVTLSPTSDSQFRVIEGTNANVTCQVDANPPVDAFVWTHTLEGQTKTLEDQTSQFLVLDGVKKAQRGDYKCEVSNAIGQGNGSLFLNVLFKPDIRIQPVYTLREGQPMELECRVEANPPPSSTVWRKNNDLASQTRFLRIPKVSRNHSGEYECSSTNAMAPTVGDQEAKTGKKTTRVVVQHVPGPAVIAGEQEVLKGSSTTLSCDLGSDFGEPRAKIHWQKPSGETIVSERVVVTNAQLDDEGRYRCFGVNEIGRGVEAEVEVVVNVAPTLMTSLVDATVESGKVHKMECKAKGKPTPDIAWYKDGHLLESGSTFELKRSVSGGESTTELIFRGVGGDNSVRIPVDVLMPEDKGEYTCKAENGWGNAEESTMKLTVEYAPKVDETVTKFAFNLGDSAELRCVADAHPPPLFTWSHAPFPSSSSSSSSSAPLAFVPVTSSRHSVISTKQSSANDTWTSVMTIAIVRIEDLGFYSCGVKNSFGEEDAKMELKVSSKPEPPTDATVTEATYNAALLSWTPGFDGGSDQTFWVEISPKTILLPNRLEATFSGQPTTFELTDLEPETRYTVSVLARNELGFGESRSVAFETEAFPLLAEHLPRVEGLSISSDEDALEIASVDQTSLAWTTCLHIETRLRDSTVFTTHARCADPEATSHALPPTSSLSAVRVSLCVKEKMDVCSRKENLEMPDNGMLTIIVAVVAAIVFVLLLLILVVFFCRKNAGRRSRSRKPITKNGAGSASSAGLDVEIGGVHDSPPPIYNVGNATAGVLDNIDSVRMASVTPDSGIENGGRHLHQHDNPALDASPVGEQYQQMQPQQNLHHQNGGIYATQTPFGVVDLRGVGNGVGNGGSLGGHYQPSHRGSNNPSRLSGAFVAKPVQIQSGGHMDWPLNRQMYNNNPYMRGSQHPDVVDSHLPPHFLQQQQQQQLQQQQSAVKSPYIIDFDEDLKKALKPDGSDSGYSASEPAIPPPPLNQQQQQQQQQQKTVPKRIIHEVIV